MSLPRGRRPKVERLADPPILRSGMKRSAEGIDHLRRCDRARARALRAMHRLFPAEYEQRWPKADRPKAGADGFPRNAYYRESTRVLRALAAAHPDEFRAVLLEELKREGIG